MEVKGMQGMENEVQKMLRFILVEMITGANFSVSEMLEMADIKKSDIEFVYNDVYAQFERKRLVFDVELNLQTCTEKDREEIKEMQNNLVKEMKGNLAFLNYMLEDVIKVNHLSNFRGR